MDTKYDIKISDIVSKYNVHIATVQREIYKGNLKAVKAGKQWRTSQEWVDAWLISNKDK